MSPYTMPSAVSERTASRLPDGRASTCARCGGTCGIATLLRRSEGGGGSDAGCGGTCSDKRPRCPKKGSRRPPRPGDTIYGSAERRLAVTALVQLFEVDRRALQDFADLR